MHYNTVHIKLRAERGNAKTHDCVLCGGQGYDWALKHEAKERVTTIIKNRGRPTWHAVSSDNLMDYVPMCKPCHMTYDEVNVPRSA